MSVHLNNGKFHCQRNYKKRLNYGEHSDTTLHRFYMRARFYRPSDFGFTLIWNYITGYSDTENITRRVVIKVSRKVSPDSSLLSVDKNDWNGQLW